jgi:hypothetical protein
LNNANEKPASPGAAADPWAGNSLVPMLIIGLVLTVLGMFAAVALS